MNFELYFHHASRQSFPKQLLDDVAATLESLQPQWVHNGAPKIRRDLLDRLHRDGWSDRVKVKRDLLLTITGISGDNGLCVQFGNVARIYADLLKLQSAYNDSVIRRSVVIVPRKDVANLLGSNLANLERLRNELRSFESIVTVPLAVFGVFDA